MDMDGRVYWIWCQRAFGAGSSKPWQIYRRFSGGIAEFYGGGAALWNSLDFITEKESMLLFGSSLDEARIILEMSLRLGQQVITPECEKYPEALRNIFDPPAVLYIKGTLPDVDNVPAIAVVGTRRCSAEGKRAATSIGYQLALDGAVVVSGGARGIDTEAHKGALRALGKSICVLPCGISDGYLVENMSLREAIAVDGAQLTEYPVNTPVTRGTFQVRNRLISGLCCATLVVEAAEKSGALITAKHAKEQDRDVFAYPGKEGDPRFAGCRRLIEDGAKPVVSGEMILEEYSFRFRPVPRGRPGPAIRHIARPATAFADAEQRKSESVKDKEEKLPGNSKKILALLRQGGSTHISEIQRQTGLGSGEALAAITELELLGFVISHPGRRFTAADSRE